MNGVIDKQPKYGFIYCDWNLVL